jgi:hypothetical protein
MNEYLPDDKVTIIVLSNLQTADVAWICHGLRSVLFAK